MHRLLRALPLAAALIALAAAPAAARIAFTSAKGYTDAGGRLVVAEDDGSGAVALGVRGSSPAISPDGTRVAYIAGAIGVGGPLRIRDVATGAEIATAEGAGVGSVTDPVWSPDGTRILLPTSSAKADGAMTGAGLSIVDAATGAVTVVVAPAGNEVTGFSWSPTGAQFAYAWKRWAGRLYGETIRIANADGTPARTIGPGSNPLWGPSRIAFQRHRSERWRGMTVYHAQLWLADPLGVAPTTQLTRYGSVGMVYGPWACCWAPDASRLYGGIGGEDMARPGSFGLATGRFRPYRTSGGELQDAFATAISADGATLLMRVGVIMGREELQLMPARGGALRPYLRHVSQISVTPSWQP